MPFFKFSKSKKEFSPAKKASSMGNLYKDYGIGPDMDQGKYTDEWDNVQQQSQQQFRERRVSDTPSRQEMLKLEKQNEELLEENNLLKLKVEILLDMLAQKSAEADIQQKDIDSMRAILTKTVS